MEEKGGESFAGKDRGQTFVVVFQQVCTDLGRDFGPLLFADPLQSLKVQRLSLGNSISAPSTDFRWDLGLETGWATSGP